MPPKRKAQEERHEDEITAKRKSSKQKSPSQPKPHHGFDHYPPSKVYRLIEPGPVLLITTGSLTSKTHNIMTCGFHMVIQHTSPPLLGISLGPWDASFALLKSQRECVIAIPSVEMAETVIDIGNCSADDGVNKWEKFGIEALKAGKVKAPLVGGKDVIANIECVVEDTKMVSKYSMWVLKPVKAWINPMKKPGEGGKMFHHRGDGTFVVDGEVLDLKGRMVKWQEFRD
jgi:flavin reductase (DIM6/NTAB) family NADH-FMN oxidoreductase RutF